MLNTFSDFNGLELFFLACAVIGGVFAVVKLVLQFAGGDADTDIGVGSDMEHVDPDVGFRLLSMHGLSTFFMMFGLVGLAFYRQSHSGAAISIAGAIVAGMVSVWVIGKIFQGAARLQSSGTLETSETLGCTGTVYLTIRKGGTGQVRIHVQNRLREFDAAEINGNEVPTGTPVRVVEVNANVLVVQIIN